MPIPLILGAAAAVTAGEATIIGGSVIGGSLLGRAIVRKIRGGSALTKTVKAIKANPVKAGVIVATVATAVYFVNKFRKAAKAQAEAINLATQEQPEATQA